MIGNRIVSLVRLEVFFSTHTIRDTRTADSRFRFSAMKSIVSENRSAYILFYYYYLLSLVTIIGEGRLYKVRKSGGRRSQRGLIPHNIEVTRARIRFCRRKSTEYVCYLSSKALPGCGKAHIGCSTLHSKFPFADGGET